MYYLGPSTQSSLVLSTLTSHQSLYQPLPTAKRTLGEQDQSVGINMSLLKKSNGMSIDHNNSTITSCIHISWIVLNQPLDSTSCHQTHILCLIGGKISAEIFSGRHLCLYFHFKNHSKGIQLNATFLANQINCHLTFYCFFLLCFVFFKQCLKEIKILINGTNSL